MYNSDRKEKGKRWGGGESTKKHKNKILLQATEGKKCPTKRVKTLSHSYYLLHHESASEL